jgi:hypothetical protein
VIRVLGCAALAFSALIGCAATLPAPASTPAPEPAAFVVPLDNNDFGSFELLVADHSLLVRTAEPLPAGVGVTDDEATADPEQRTLTVKWVGGACDPRPLLSIAGDETLLRVTLDPSPPVANSPVNCRAIGFTFGAVLTLAVPVEQSAIEFTSLGQ